MREEIYRNNLCYWRAQKELPLELLRLLSPLLLSKQLGESEQCGVCVSATLTLSTEDYVICIFSSHKLRCDSRCETNEPRRDDLLARSHTDLPLSVCARAICGIR